jgi:hypothetical protein
MEEGVGFILTVPSPSVQMSFEMKARAQNAPSNGARVVGNRIYYRPIPNNASFGTTWNQILLNNMTMATGSTLFQYKPRQTVPFVGGFSPGVTPGTLYQFELTRVAPSPAASNLTGDWNLVELIVEFT